MAKSLTPEEEYEIRRLYQDGHTTLEIEKITGRSHTSINKITKGLPRFSPSSRSSPSPAKSTEIPTRPQVPSPPKKIYLPVPSGFSDPYQTSYYSEPNQDQYQSPRMPMNPLQTDHKQDQYLQKIQEEERKREQQHKQDMDQMIREHEERMTQLRQRNEQIIKQNQQQRNEAELRELKEKFEQVKKNQSRAEEKLRELQSQLEISEQRHLQEKKPFTLPPIPPAEQQKDNLVAVKETPVKEKPTQISAENKPSPVCKSSTMPQDSSLQDSNNTREWDIVPIVFELLKAAPDIITVIGDLRSAWKTGVYRNSLKNKIVQKGVSNSKKTPDTKSDDQMKNQNRDLNEGTATTNTKG